MLIGHARRVAARVAQTYWETGACLNQKGAIPITDQTTVTIIDKPGHRYNARFRVDTVTTAAAGARGSTGKCDLTYFMAADTEDDRNAWVAAIEEVIAAKQAFLRDA